jgi:hypothetical protein
MSTQAKQASIVCELCGVIQEVNFRDQRRRYCSKCNRKLSKVAVKVQKELDTQQLAAKAKASKKPPVVHLHCDTCGKTFICPTCSPAPKKVKSKKASPKKTTQKSKVKKGGPTNAKK